MQRQTLLKAFGQSIKQERERLHISQEELAARADLDRTYISGLERGVRNPSLTARDVVEQRQRSAHELIIDHRFPMLRWGKAEDAHKHHSSISDDDIKIKFQLLKKDSSSNHNLLKSRDCENCFKFGERGSPFGIEFYYKGDKKWPKNIPVDGSGAEAGCVGCGWYDFAKWRMELNEWLAKQVAKNLQ